MFNKIFPTFLPLNHIYRPLVSPAHTGRKYTHVDYFYTRGHKRLNCLRLVRLTRVTFLTQFKSHFHYKGFYIHDIPSKLQHRNSIKNTDSALVRIMRVQYIIYCTLVSPVFLPLDPKYRPVVSPAHTGRKCTRADSFYTRDSIRLNCRRLVQLARVAFPAFWRGDVRSSRSRTVTWKKMEEK